MIRTGILIFTTIFLGEIGDKTQISMFLLASKIKNHSPLLLGILLAFALENGLAVIFASLLVHVLSLHIIKLLSAGIFIIFGIYSIVQKSENETDEKIQSEKNPFLLGLTVTLIAELGDKSQIAMALFATRYSALIVYLIGIIALTIISVITIYGGKYICAKINKIIIHRISGILFILIGIWFLF